MLVSLEDMKEYLDIDDADSDAYLTNQLKIFSRIIENHCNRKFLLHEVTKKFSFNRCETRARESIYFFDSPIESIVLVKECDEELEATDYELENDRLFRLKDGKRCLWASSVEVKYNAGWEEAPEDLQSIVKDLVAQAYSKKDSGESSALLDNNEYTKVVIPGVITTEKVSNSSFYPTQKGGAAILLGPYTYLLDHYVIPSGVC